MSRQRAAKKKEARGSAELAAEGCMHRTPIPRIAERHQRALSAVEECYGPRESLGEVAHEQLKCEKGSAKSLTSAVTFVS